MNIEVRYLAQLRPAAGRGAETVEAPDGCTVAALLRLLAGRGERLRAVLLDQQGDVRATILAFVGEEQAERDRVLRDGDEVTLMTPIAGGAR
jgi:molybdopterin converting factor small subunit